ncbi:Protein SENSITIVITY TO RED LIGHT REDUCED 1 [Tetrabaena socialis]|uniref:Protein SENSITIVITY TO RED LIGHT REDUCED 1 n=1 Tax=Tetrabaena socialis TaxID=47790 RepID=A0A2J8AEX6_9CHLO|nr:Protein SENSITIVITY TO RED LIGHT REDUCED 1 [Tetrabaena socialis]|eukprot:PNH11059.1 Protein SENSITIVITY TO RED LIGHT REDUCED 1 [Tetrabaena socialis]
MDDGWTVVRGKGKGKARGPPLKRARDECCPGEASACAAAPAANGSDGDGVAGAACPDQPAEPGASGGGRGGGGGRTGRPGRRGFRERTAAEQCEQLVAAITLCKQEVAGSAFFARLLAVMADAGPHLRHLQPSAAPTELQQRQQQGQEQGQQPQQQQENQASHRHGVHRAGVDAMAEDGCSDGSGGGGNEGVSSGDGGGGSGGGGDGDGSGGGGGGRHPAWLCMQSMVVYGLGSAHDSRVSRYQLALVLLLRDRLLLGLSAPVQLYDPAFDEVDRAALASLGMQVLEVNEGGARVVAGPTFFYLPHCEGVLCDALLGANWSCCGGGGGGGGGGDDGGSSTATPALPGARADPEAGMEEGAGAGEGKTSGGESGSEGTADCGGGGGGGRRGLPLLALLGNSFSTYLDRWEVRCGGAERRDGGPQRPARIIRCCQQGAVVELHTPDLRFQPPSAFNDMALHLFPPSAALQGLLSGQAKAAQAST